MNTTKQNTTATEGTEGKPEVRLQLSNGRIVTVKEPSDQPHKRQESAHVFYVGELRDLQRDLDRVTAQRDALLAALKNLHHNCYDGMASEKWDSYERAEAAIAAVEKGSADTLDVSRIEEARTNG